MDAAPKPRTSLSRLNLGLTVLIVLINLYILSAPLVPQLGLWWHRRQAKPVAGLPYKTQLDQHSQTDQIRKTIPTDNRLVIPKIALDQHIYEGDSAYLVHKGVWARPKTSTPPNGSNTVLVGHRFTYSGPATFYSLDKVGVGDQIVLYWQGKEYDYKVSSTRVVPAVATEIEDQTKDPQLTIYTCTPIWSATDRLVVVAKPIGVSL